MSCSYDNYGQTDGQGILYINFEVSNKFPKYSRIPILHILNNIKLSNKVLLKYININLCTH